MGDNFYLIGLLKGCQAVSCMVNKFQTRLLPEFMKGKVTRLGWEDKGGET